MNANCLALRRHAPGRGFTLIELMIVVAIVAIVAAVALPSYFGSVRKSRRADAVSAVSQIQQGQERWRANNPAYTSTLSDVNVTATTSSGYYNMATAALSGNLTNSCTGTTVACAVGTCYSATATAVVGKSQANDTACTTMTSYWYGPTGKFCTTPSTCWGK